MVTLCLYEQIKRYKNHDKIYFSLKFFKYNFVYNIYIKHDK